MGGALGWAGSGSAGLAFKRRKEPEIRPVRCGVATEQPAGYPLASRTPAQTGSWELQAAHAAVRAIQSHSQYKATGGVEGLTNWLRRRQRW